MNARKREYVRLQYIRFLTDQIDTAEREREAPLWWKLIHDLARIPGIWGVLNKEIYVGASFHESLLTYYRDTRPAGWDFSGLCGLEVYGKRIVPVVELKRAE